MATQFSLKDDIAINKDFELLTRSYQQHAVGQINFARYSVLYAREFSKDLAEIFANVRYSYKSLDLQKGIDKIIKKNGKDIWILLSANNKLYGDIVIKSFRLFQERLKTADLKKVDLVIIGRQGKKMMHEAGIKVPYEYLELPDTNVAVEYLKKICAKLIYYENVYVFYGRFNNLVSQTPVQVALSGEMPLDDPTDKISKNRRKFLFEPSMEEILSFFENQILSLLLNQTVQEAQLARYASRITAMESAQNNIQTQLGTLTRAESRIKAMEINKKQSELLAGRRLWGRK
jgi:F-type H+-transporting ATPase subunit gamma